MPIELAVSNVITLKPKNAKKVSSKVKYPDNFPDDQQHMALILDNPYPFSVFIDDNVEIMCRIGHVKANWHSLTLTIAWALITAARSLLRLKFPLFINPCQSSGDSRSLLEITKIMDDRTFAKYFMPVGATYKNWTEYGNTAGDKFDGKMFLRVLGNGGRPTTFFLNHAQVILLAQEIGVMADTAFRDFRKANPNIKKKKSLMENYVNPYKV